MFVAAWQRLYVARGRHRAAIFDFRFANARREMEQVPCFDYCVINYRDRLSETAQVIRSIIQVRKQREWDPLLTQLDRWLELLDGDRGAAVDVRSRLERLRGVIALADRMALKFLKGGAIGSLGLKALVRSSRAGRHR